MEVFKKASLFILVLFISILGLAGIASAQSSAVPHTSKEYTAIFDTLAANKTISFGQAVKLNTYFMQKEAEKNAERQKMIDEIILMGYLTSDQAEMVFKAIYTEDFRMAESIENGLAPLTNKKVITTEQSMKLYGYFAEKLIEFKGNMIEELASNTDLSIDEAEEVLKATHWSATGPKDVDELAHLLKNGTIIEDDLNDVISYYKGVKYEKRQQELQELITAADLSRSQAKAVLKNLSNSANR